MVQQFNESAGNTAFSFNGNEDEARKLIPTAQNLLYKLRGFLATSGSKVFSMTTRASNGSVTASSIEGIEKVIITADGQITDEPVDVEGIEILSGAVKGGEIATITPPVMGEPQFKTLQQYKPTAQAYKYPLKKRPGNYPKTVILPGNTFEDQPRLAVKAFSPMLPLDEIDKPNWFFCGNKLFAESLAGVIETGLSQLESEVISFGYDRTKVIKGTGYYAVLTMDSGFVDHVFIYADGTPEVDETISQSKEIVASRYSGYMAKCVQLLLGLGKLKSAKAGDSNRTIGVQVKYDWRWARCHGIVRGSDGAFWLVEISALNGIIAMPLPMFVNTIAGTIKNSMMKASKQDVLKEAWKTFNGIPTGATFPPRVSTDPNIKNLAQSIADGDVIQLKTASEMSAYFEKVPYSTDMGWTFNEGTSSIASEAHNTCCRLPVYGAAIGTENHDTHTYHYKITFSIGAIVKQRMPDQPIATGSATFSLVDSGILVSAPDFEDRGYSPIFVRKKDSFVKHILGFADTYAPKPTVIACYMTNVLKTAWAEHLPQVVVSSTQSDPLGDLGYVSGTGDNDIAHNGSGPGASVITGTYSGSSNQQVRQLTQLCRSDDCLAVPTVTKSDASSGITSVAGRDEPASPYVVVGMILSSSGEYVTTTTYPEHIVRWSSESRDAYQISKQYTKTRTITSSGYWTQTGIGWGAGYYTSNTDIEDAINIQPNIKVAYDSNDTYEIPDIVGLPLIYTPPDEFNYSRTISRFKYSKFGSGLNLVYDDYAYDANSASLLADKTVCAGLLLSTEANVSKVNYSFIGYV